MEVGGFDKDRGVEMTLTQVHVDVQKRDFGGRGVPNKLDGIAVVEALDHESEGGNVIDKVQPEGRFLECGVKKICSRKPMNR